MRRATKIVTAIGVSLAVILGLWLLIAPGRDLDPRTDTAPGPRGRRVHRRR